MQASLIEKAKSVRLMLKFKYLCRNKLFQCFFCVFFKDKCYIYRKHTTGTCHVLYLEFTYKVTVNSPKQKKFPFANHIRLDMRKLHRELTQYNRLSTNQMFYFRFCCVSILLLSDLNNSFSLRKKESDTQTFFKRSIR